MTNFRTIIHIGLPKTGTTSLQSSIYPLICKENNFIYKPYEFFNIVKKKYLYSKEDKKKLRNLIKKKNIFLSKEDLVGENPRNWTLNANKILDLFGKKAKIIITIRDPYDYLTSAYVQKIHERNIILPSDFFISKKDYNKINPFLASQLLQRFDYESLDYEKLKKIYKDRFDDVYIVPLSCIKTLYPLDKLIPLSSNDIKNYRKKFIKSKRYNRSYSGLAIKLTFLRESLINLIGLKSKGSNELPRNNIFFEDMQKQSSFKNSTTIKKFYLIILKLSYKLSKIFKWKWWMQEVLDKCGFYKKYKLPDYVIKKFDQKLMKRNVNFVKRYEKLIDKHFKKNYNC